MGGQRDRGSIRNECGGDNTDGTADLVLEQFCYGFNPRVVESCMREKGEILESN